MFSSLCQCTKQHHDMTLSSIIYSNSRNCLLHEAKCSYEGYGFLAKSGWENGRRFKTKQQWQQWVSSYATAGEWHPHEHTPDIKTKCMTTNTVTEHSLTFSLRFQCTAASCKHSVCSVSEKMCGVKLKSFNFTGKRPLFQSFQTLQMP